MQACVGGCMHVNEEIRMNLLRPQGKRDSFEFEDQGGFNQY